jgi:hypothetical protein
MPGGVGWTVDRPTKQRQGRSDTTLFMICRAKFGGEESFLPDGQRDAHAERLGGRQRNRVFGSRKAAGMPNPNARAI